MYLGLVKSSPDPRDFLYSRISAPISLPAKYTLPTPDGFIVNNQGQRGTCVGQSAAVVKEFLDAKERGYWQDYSADYIWNLCKLHDTFPDTEGTDLRTACKMVQQYGVCEEKLMPYKLTRYAPKWPTNEQKAAAYPNRILSYARVQTEQEIKQALYEQQTPVMIGVIVMENFYNTVNGVVPMPQGKIMGGHAMALVGYDDEKRLYEVINSWGVGYPTKNGRNFLPYDYVHGKSDSFAYLIDAFSWVDLVAVVPDVLYPDNVLVKITVNGKVIDTQDAIPFIVNNRTYVPIRFVSEALGRTVDWDANTNTVHIR